MVIPTDILQDTLILGLVSVLGVVIKTVFKPSKAEAEMLARVMVFIAVLVVKLIRKWQSSHKEHADIVLTDLIVLKNKFSRKKEVLG